MNKTNRCAVEIIIPVYNAEQTLRHCLDSLVNQRFTDWRAILVNDASTDSSADIMAEYASADERFVCINHQTNCGASEAKNTALKIVTAEYIAFLDSDDYWEEDMLYVMYGKALEYKADVVQCRFIYDLSDGKRLLPSGAFGKDTFLEGRALRRVYRKMMTGINMNHACMKLIKSAVTEGVAFDKSLPTAEDLDFCVKIFKNVKRYYFCTNVMYHYCRRENSLTGRGLPFSVRLKSNRRVARTMASMLQYWGIDNVFYRSLTYFRPYIIIVSKLFRIIREKLLTE